MTLPLLRVMWMIDTWDFGNLKSSGKSREWRERDEPLFGIKRSELKAKLMPASIMGIEW